MRKPRQDLLQEASADKVKEQRSEMSGFSKLEEAKVFKEQ